MADNDFDFTIRALQKGDCKSPFSLSGEEDLPLKTFFRRDAEKAGNSFITQTYVAVPADEADKRILGYMSLMSAEIAVKGLYPIADKPRADRYPSQPAVRIARLAVNDELRGRGIGKDLVALGFSVSLDRICPFVGCRFLIVNAKRKSIDFYVGRGFTILETAKNTESPAPIMWLDLKLYAERQAERETAAIAAQ
ncbi:hypothetical protein O7A70_06250 [Mesorhizobium sp. Cs1299R1N1]|uniref:GNAT family N-acetyltransferase n=1 Tax=Mesorhizobium sp. Cs1299R1N1 TaxID=3015172 RepID=UPI00301D80C7